jgi:triosephosphate isomerase
MYKLIINLKTYEQSSNKNAIKIAKICKQLEKEAKKRNIELILCPQFIDLKDIKAQKVKTYAQHIDNIKPGQNTGFISPKALKEAKIDGSLISHSEHKLSLKEINERIKIAKEYNLESCVCARNSSIAKKIAKLKPDYIAIEPKELIGIDISISTAKPHLIEKAVKVVENIPLLVGAGIKTKDDVKKAIELGAKGILVASGVVKAKNIKKEILNLIKGFT